MLVVDLRYGKQRHVFSKLYPSSLYPSCTAHNQELQRNIPYRMVDENKKKKEEEVRRRTTTTTRTITTVLIPEPQEDSIIVFVDDDDERTCQQHMYWIKRGSNDCRIT